MGGNPIRGGVGAIIGEGNWGEEGRIGGNPKMGGGKFWEPAPPPPPPLTPPFSPPNRGWLCGISPFFGGKKGG